MSIKVSGFSDAEKHPQLVSIPRIKACPMAKINKMLRKMVSHAEIRV